MSFFRTAAIITGPLLLCGTLALPAAAKPAPAKAKPKLETLTLPVEGVTAQTKGKALKKIEKAVKKVKGVVSVAVDKKTGHLVIKHKATATAAAIEAALTKAGFKVTKTEEADIPEAVDDEPADDEAEIDDE